MADQSPKKRLFGLSTLSVDNATSVFLLSFVIMLFGIISYIRMPKEQFPEVDWPAVYINTPYFGNSAADIENLVTRPIEKQLQSITSIKDIKSTSIQDYSVITAEFDSDVDIEDAVRKVKDAVDKAKADLPNDLDQEPAVLDINLSEIPIMVVNISGDYTNDELRNFAEYIQDEIEKVDEIARVELKGSLEREVKVDIDLLKMESMKVNFGDVENAIASENLTMSAGELVNNDFRRAIRVKGEFDSVEELENMIVKSEDQRPIYLKDIASVTMGYKERSSIARSDGYPVISLDVIKRQGENLLNAADEIKTIIEDAKTKLPADLKISLFNDQSVYTRNEVNNLENSIISGVILVVLILLFFLGIRNSLFVGMAIPLSMMMGILLLSLTGVTMNIVVLFALIMGLGMLVDNAIVVVENTYRHYQEGYSLIDSAKYGVGEVAMPIISSTATTLAAFIPLAFWPGIMGSFMQYLPITLILVLSASLFVALVINPVFTAKLMTLDERGTPADERRRRRNALIFSFVMIGFALIGQFSGALWLRNLMGISLLVNLLAFFILRPGSFVFQDRVLPRIESGYDKFVRSALRRPMTVFLGTFGLLFLSIILVGIRRPKVIFFPSADPVYVNVFVELPLGKDIEATDRLMRELEGKVDKAIAPYKGIVEAVLSQIGENTSDPNGPPEPGASPHKARLTVSFVASEDRKGISTFEVMNKMRDAVQGYAGVQISVAKNADGPSTGKPINLEIQGENMDQLATLSENIINFINDKAIPGIEQLQSDVKIGKPELVVKINREAARRYEISTANIATAIRTAVFGKEVSKFKQGEDEYPIVIRLDERYRYDVDNLLNQRITFRSPANGQLVQVPISAVADIEYASTYSAVKRKNLDRVITIYSNVIEGYNANEIIAQMDEAMKTYKLPIGYSYEFTGEQQQQAEDMSFLVIAFLVALFSIYLIIVAQFNSILSPLIIMFSVLFSTIGVFLGYAVTGLDISVIFTGVGIISLAGIVVNNAIVLIDYTNIMIDRKIAEAGVEHMNQLSNEDIKEAIVKAGATRLRPVLLTAITTILGLIPLAIGFNFNFFTLISELDPHVFVGGDNTAIWGPLAWTVIYGLTFSTVLTLVVVPAMFWLSYRLKEGILRPFRRKPTTVVSPPQA